MNELIKTMIRMYWKPILGLICLCFVIWQNQKLNNANTEIDKLKSIQSVIATIEAMDKKLSEIKDRERLYIELEAKLESLEQARQSLKAAEAKLKQPNKGDITNENSKLNEKQLSDWFNLNGFNTSIGICR